MKIDKPGIYRGISDADYRADPCPAPSLTQSTVKTLIERSPLHAWTDSSRLNPNYEHDNDTKFDLGNIAHSIILGRGKEIEVVQFDDWRKKEAREAREAAADQGRIAVLQHQFEQASEMVAAAWSQLKRHEDHDAFTGGSGEVMIAWQEDGMWFRSLIDWLDDDLRTVTDYKTSKMSMAPHLIGLRAEAAGWHIQNAFIERGLDILDPAGAGRRRFRNVAQETDKPHALTVIHMDERWLTMGRKQIEPAIRMWRYGIESGQWPSYTNRAIVPEFPGFKENRWLERELSGEFESENDSSLVMAG